MPTITTDENLSLKHFLGSLLLNGHKAANVCLADNTFGVVLIPPQLGYRCYYFLFVALCSPSPFFISSPIAEPTWLYYNAQFGWSHFVLR